MSMTSAGLGGRLALPNPENGRSIDAGLITNGLSFRDILALVFKHKFRVLTALVVPPAIAALLIVVLPPSYRAQISLVVGTGPEYLAQGDGSSILTAPTATKQEFINTEIELLADPAVTRDTIKQFGLANLYPDLVQGGAVSEDAMDAAVRKFQSSLKVSPVKLSNVIRVTFDHSIPQVASRVLDQFIAGYEELHAKVYANRRAASYEERIARDMQELDRLERTRAEPKAAYGIFDLSQQRSALIQQRVDAVKRLAETVNRADALRTRLAYLTETRPKLPSQIASSQTETNLVAVHARQALVDLREKEAVMAVTYDPHHPLLMRLRQQIDMVQKELSTMQDTSTRISLSPSPIASSVDQEIVTSRAELAPLQDQASRDKELVGSITDELRHIEQADMQLRILDSRIVDQNENLKMMRQLYDKARTEDEMDQAKVTSVVQTAHATTPDKPVAPNKFLLAVGGALAGLISACGVVILATITNRNFLSEGALERFLGLPVLGSIPLQAPERRRLV